MGVLDLVRGRNDSQHVQNIAIGNPDPNDSEPKGATDAPPAYDSSDNAERTSLEARNEKEIEEHPDEVTENAHLGVKKAEAAALVWSKKAVYATYAW